MDPVAADPVAAAPVAEVPVTRYVRIFVCAIALFVVQAAFPEGDVARVLEVLLAGTALVLASSLESGTRVRRRVAFGVAVLSVVIAAVQLALPETGDASGGLLLVNGFLVAAGPVLIFGSIRRHSTVTIRTVLGAITIYVLFGLFFAFVYRSILMFDAESFVSANGPLDPAAMQYFSFVTLTTVGFGDITAVASTPRTLVALEALFGQVYLVTVVAMVVGNLGRRRESMPAG